MATRGSYRKGVEKRAEILAKAVELTDREGFSSATVRRLADEVGLSPNGVLHYFGSRDGLLVEVLRERDAAAFGAAADRDAARETSVAPGGADAAHEIAEQFVAALTAGLRIPGHAQFMAHMLAASTDPGHVGHDYVGQRYAQVNEAFTAVFERLAREGRLRDGVDPRTAAAALVALSDGLQLQWLHDPDDSRFEAVLRQWLALVIADD